MDSALFVLERVRRRLRRPAGRRSGGVYGWRDSLWLLRLTLRFVSVYRLSFSVWGVTFIGNSGKFGRGSNSKDSVARCT